MSEYFEEKRKEIKEAQKDIYEYIEERQKEGRPQKGFFSRQLKHKSSQVFESLSNQDPIEYTLEVLSQPMYSRSLRVIGIGAPMLDYIAYVDESYLEKIGFEKGERRSVDFDTFCKLKEEQAELKVAPGGQSANFLRALSHLGNRCILVGAIGADDEGELVAKDLKQHKIITSWLPLEKGSENLPSARSLIFVTKDGVSTIAYYRGAFGKMFWQALGSKQLARVSLLYAEGFMIEQEEALLRAMQMTKMLKGVVVFDLSSTAICMQWQDEIFKLLKLYVDLVVGSDRQAMALTGSSSAEEACRKLGEKSAYVFVTCGKKLIISVHGVQKELPLFDVEVKDDLGAPTYFVAGFVHGLMRGLPLPQSILIGSILRAEILGEKGSALPEERWQEIIAVLEKQGLS